MDDFEKRYIDAQNKTGIVVNPEFKYGNIAKRFIIDLTDPVFKHDLHVVKLILNDIDPADNYTSEIFGVAQEVRFYERLIRRIETDNPILHDNSTTFGKLVDEVVRIIKDVFILKQ